jgi:hypothetical protein
MLQADLLPVTAACSHLLWCPKHQHCCPLYHCAGHQLLIHTSDYYNCQPVLPHQSVLASGSKLPIVSAIRLLFAKLL